MNVFYTIIPNLFMSAQELGPDELTVSYNYLNIIIFIILGISIVLNIYLLLSNNNNNNNNNKGKRSNSRVTTKDYESWYKTIERTNKQLETENHKLKSKLNSLQNKKASLYEETKDVKVDNQYQKPVTPPIIEERYDDEKPNTFDLKITKPNAIYLPSPFEDNRFSIEDVSSDQTPSSLYKIVLDGSNLTGELKLIENADFTRALNSPDHYLEKACIYENAFSAAANRIHVIESGKVKLDNQDWLITEKIKIKFI